MKNVACQNCMFFVRHYVKHGTQITTANCGHCKNPRLTVLQREKQFQAASCEFWVSDESNKKMQKQNLEQVLYQIAEQLSAIAAILEKD